MNYNKIYNHNKILKCRICNKKANTICSQCKIIVCNMCKTTFKNYNICNLCSGHKIIKIYE